MGIAALAAAMGCDANDAGEDTDGASPAGTASTTGGDDGGGAVSTTAQGDDDDGGVTSTTDATTLGTSGTDESSGEGDGSSGSSVEAVPVFMAAGDVGRTTFSCDLGAAWTGNRSYDLEGDPLVCGEAAPVVCYDDATGCQLLDGEACEQQATNCDCDHHPGAVQGLAYGDGWWVATWGWGPPGSVRRSQDGLNWETVVEGTTFGGLAYGDGTFLLGARSPQVSTDGGATWVEGGPADFQAANGTTIQNVRRVAYAPAQGGHFVVVATSGDSRDIMLSSDAGASWWRPAQRPEACLDNTQGILSSQDTMVLLGRNGEVCTSGDGGQTWAVDTPLGGGGPGLWDGSAFRAWTGGNAYESTDGITWTSQPMVPSLQLAATAVDPQTGTFVSVRGGWQNWYDRQEFYRSDDGVTWTVLDAAAFEGSHRIRHVEFARTETGVCID